MSTAILIIESLYGMHENQLLKKLGMAEVCINIILAVELIMRAGTCPTFWILAVDVQTWLDTLALLGALLAMVRVETSHVVSELLSPIKRILQIKLLSLWKATMPSIQHLRAIILSNVKQFQTSHMKRSDC